MMRRFFFFLTPILLVVFISVSLNSKDILAASQRDGDAEGPPGTLLYSGDTSGISKVPDDHTMEKRVAAAYDNEPGKSCKTVDFEGIGNLSPVPEFDGITSPEWLGIIDYDAGGTGNFAYEPSPETIAFWLEGDPLSRSIDFAEAISEITFYYASAVDIKLEAFDEYGNSLGIALGLANYNKGPGGDPYGKYNKWDPITLETDGNSIRSVMVIGKENQTGIDDLKVCRKIGINSVEFTQAIQEFQTLEDFKNDISGDKTPPVPIVANKPLALRVYMEEVDTATDVTLKLSGVVTQEQTVTIQPNCTAESSRLQKGGCKSANFYFTPPKGEWTVTLKSFDSKNYEIESHDFALKSVSAEPIVLGSVQVCDSKDASGNWQCATNYHTRLSQLVPLLRKISPTHAVRIVDTGDVVRRDINSYDADGNGSINNNEDEGWWDDAVDDIGNFYTLFDSVHDLTGVEDRIYYGIARPVIPGGTLGVAADIPSQSALSISSASDLGVDVSQDTVAHEAFHTLGRRHTNQSAPAGTTAPGCHLSVDPGTDWPFANNRIQSANQLEVGFDVATKTSLDPQKTFDIMSYCAPVWISPHTYTKLLDGPLKFASSKSTQETQTETGNFWLISGSIGKNSVAFDPLVLLETAGSSEQGHGTHAIDVVNADGELLFRRRFKPYHSHTRVALGYNDHESEPIISELIPYQSGARRIIVRDAGSDDIGVLNLTGSAPTVNITYPAGGEMLSGVETLRWESADSKGDSLFFWVHYSAEGGVDGTWRTIAKEITSAELSVDFDQLPGSGNRAVIRVIATDGINSGSDVSNRFSVPKKLPDPTILFPADGDFFQRGQLVWLQGEALDIDDGFLENASLSWSSDIDGALGNGRSLHVVDLSVGEHTVTLEATDSDGNSASRLIKILVDGSPPVLDFEVEIDGIPATCVEVSIDAADSESDLADVQYSLDGGSFWAPVDLSGLPLNFVVPGKGFFHIVTRATDQAGNQSVADDRVFIENECPNATPVADIGGPYTGYEGNPITLDGSSSSDSDGSIIVHEWDLDNDGQFDDGVGENVQVLFGDNGSFAVHLRVTDDGGAIATTSTNVEVSNVPPVVVAGPNVSTVPDDIVSLSSAYFTDSGTLDTHTATIDWGNGSQTAGSVTQAGAILGSYSYPEEGNFTVNVCVTDDDGGEGCDSFTTTFTKNFVIFTPLVRK